MKNHIGPEEIMKMATGFWVSKALFSGLELGVFEALSSGPARLSDLASSLKLPSASLERLLIALISLGLLEQRGEQYANSSSADSFLTKKSPTFVAGNFSHLNNDLYPLWRYLSDAIREDSSRWQQAFGPDMSKNPFDALYSDQTRLMEFLLAMSGMTAVTSRELLEHFDFSPYRFLLDIGGALGTFSIAVLSKNRGMRATLFDLPPVGPLAKEHIAKLGFSDRISVQTGDMFNDPLPEGADIITLGWILHDWDDERCLQILKRCFAALPSGGTIMLLEKFLNDERSGPIWPALMSLNMLVATAGGRERTAGEYGNLLVRAGFVDPQSRVLTGMRDYILARKP
jgi:hypothetical protein